MLATALLVLTLTADDAVRLTLTENETAGECQAAKTMVETILSDAGHEIIAAMCGSSALRLTPFDHGLGAEHETHLYRVEIAGDGNFAVIPLAAEDNCEPSEVPKVYCTRSSQSVVSTAGQ